MNEDDVRTVVPNIPVWGVFYSDETDTVEAYPVLWFETRRGGLGGDRSFDMFKPVCFSSDGWLESESETANFLGLSLSPSPDRKDYEEQVAAYLSKQGLKAAIRK